MSIKTVSIIGLGALGILYADHFSKQKYSKKLQIIADETRIKHYKEQGIYCNDALCHFNFVTPEEIDKPSDLIIVATKFDGLQDAIRSISPAVGEQTIILSVLNGIISEDVLAEAFGYDKLLYCVAQGMDALKINNKMQYTNKGILCFGADHPQMNEKHVNTVAKFFKKTKMPFEVDTNMRHRLWGKLMLNVGVNQTLASIEGTYQDIFIEGDARNTLIGAMEEVLTLANLEGVPLTKDDLNYWLDVLSTLDPNSKPSMAQDVEAKRFSELPLFAGTIIELGHKHNVSTPVNEKLFHIIAEKESSY